MVHFSLLADEEWAYIFSHFVQEIARGVGGREKRAAEFTQHKLRALDPRVGRATQNCKSVFLMFTIAITCASASIQKDKA